MSTLEGRALVGFVVAVLLFFRFVADFLDLDFGAFGFAGGGLSLVPGAAGFIVPGVEGLTAASADFFGFADRE